MIAIIITIILDIILCMILIPIKLITNVKGTFVFFVIIVIDLLFWTIIRLAVPDGVKHYLYFGENDQYCVTVWKKSNGPASFYAYIISGKYKKNRKDPQENYIKINMGDHRSPCWATVFVSPEGNLLVDADNVDTICSEEGSIELYNNNKEFNDSIYTYIEKGERYYNSSYNYVCIDFIENFAIDNNGKKQHW